jgi:hypothetical protein
MSSHKESFFWTSYSDLMTSLFFVMLVLFVFTVGKLNKRNSVTQQKLDRIKQIEASTKSLDKTFFIYDSVGKKYKLNIQCQFARGSSDIFNLNNKDYNGEFTRKQLRQAGFVINSFLKNNSQNRYIIIIEGQASKDNYINNYQLSYERALSLVKFWKGEGIDFIDNSVDRNCEIQIAGSGDGRLTSEHRAKYLAADQQFIIYLLPKNIIPDEDKK